MLPEEIKITSNKQEDVFEMQAEYPYVMRKIHTRPGKKIASWHWHEELEFVYVRMGAVDYITPQGSVSISEGDGIFVNSNVLHQVVSSVPAAEILYEVHMLRRNFLAEKESLLDKKYVRPFLQNRSASFLPLKKEEELCRDILTRLALLSEWNDRRTFGYEVRVRNILSEIWLSVLEFWEQGRSDFPSCPLSNEMRWKEMLLFIQEHYMDNISLKDIAGAASISERECLRSFRKGLGITPFACLQEYRIQTACSLLKNTPDKIVEIAGKCGFNSSSYFGKVFYKQMHCTPYEYRKNPDR